MAKKALTRESFITKCEEKHGDRFDYVDTVYKNRLTPTFFICKKHGKFTTTPNNHLISENGGCRQCVEQANGNSHRKDKNHFIKKAKNIHGDFYDYSCVEYTHSLNYIDIICPNHGKFSMKASNHINNKQGCPICAKKRTANKLKIGVIDFINRIADKPNFENYDFTEIREFKNLRSNISPICVKHGKYTTTPKNILNSNFFGCKQCRIESSTHDLDIFIERSKSFHGEKYQYDKTAYSKSHDDVIVTCPIHGDFNVKAYIHVAGNGHCPKCTSYVSSYEIEILEYLKSIGINDIEGSVRRLPNIKEIDILSEEYKIGIEFNGLYWHSDIHKNNNYHLKKSKAVNNLGYRLIQIFEDEWIFNRNVCESILRNAFKKNVHKIFARKCSIVNVDHKTAKKFLLDNHIQGFCVSKYRFGLMFKGELVSLMTFGKKRRNLGNVESKNGEYELLRFCNKINHSVVGGASKIFRHFIKEMKPQNIISFCNMRYGTGNLYKTLGFTEKHTSAPNYFYVKGLKRHNRFAFRKDVLLSKGYPKDKTEKEIMKDLGYYRIYDCGNKKYEWTTPLNKCDI